MRGRKRAIVLRHPTNGLYYIGRQQVMRLGPKDRAVTLTARHLQYVLPRLKKKFGVDFIQEDLDHGRTHHLHPAEAGAPSTDFDEQHGRHPEGDADRRDL